MLLQISWNKYELYSLNQIVEKENWKLENSIYGSMKDNYQDGD